MTCLCRVTFQERESQSLVHAVRMEKKYINLCKNNINQIIKQ